MYIYVYDICVRRHICVCINIYICKHIYIYIYIYILHADSCYLVFIVLEVTPARVHVDVDL